MNGRGLKKNPFLWMSWVMGRGPGSCDFRSWWPHQWMGRCLFLCQSGGRVLTFCTLKMPAMPVNSLMLVGGRWPPGASSVISVSVWRKVYTASEWRENILRPVFRELICKNHICYTVGSEIELFLFVTVTGIYE